MDWRPIETAYENPEVFSGQFVQIYQPGKTVVTAYLSQCNLGWRSVPGDKSYKPTHWTPLAEPPVTKPNQAGA